ncbi:MAG: protein kinase domain-containing protein [Planctomycetota bacterium]|jgi:serine/threonine protein kinase
MADKTGKMLNEKYLIGDFIGRDGIHEVYFCTQQIADGIERKLALKLLYNWSSIKEDERRSRIEELNTIAQIGAHPFIISVCDCGVDEELGPWRVMEPAIGAMDKVIADEPANPALVRRIMDSMLQALTSVHEHEKPIIHNNIKPRSVLQLTPDSWVLGNFNLAAVSGDEHTLGEVTSKYSSPEILDVDFGEIGKASDLYSLGFCLYEAALGTRRFKEVFPSVYGSEGGSAKGSSENDKWVYWHVSPQLSVPSLKEQLPDFPQDLSDSIELMMKKSLDERSESARLLWENISKYDVAAGSVWKQPDKPSAKKEGPVIPKAVLLAVGIVLLVVIALGGAVSILSGPSTPVLKMGKEAYLSNSRFMTITGTVEDIEPGSKIVLTAGKDLLRSRVEAKIASDTGKFSAKLELPVLGEYEGLCGVLSPKGDILATAIFDITRDPPQEVEVAFITDPIAYSAEVAVSQLVAGKNKGEMIAAGKRSGITDSKGRTSISIPYGHYSLVLRHPRFQQYKRKLKTGLGSEKAIELRLEVLPPSVLKEKRQALKDEYERLKAAAAAGDPAAIARMAEIQKQLAQLADKPKLGIDGEGGEAAIAKRAAIQKERLALLNEAEELRKRAAAGDPEAIKRLQEINKRLEELNKEEAAIAGASSMTELDKLAKRRAELVRRAAAGDPAAIAALKKLDKELRERGIDPENIMAGSSATSAAAKKAAIRKRMQELAARVAAGDPEAIAEMNRLKKELAAIDDSEAAKQKRKKEILKRMQELQARAAAGDPEAIAEMNRLKKELESIDSESALEDTAAKRQRIIDEMKALQARVAAGDPEAIAKFKALQAQLVGLDAAGDGTGTAADKRKKLIERIKALRERAAAGDPDAIRELKALERKSAILKALSEGRITEEEAERLLKGAQKLSVFDRMTLMAMDLDTLRQYIVDDMPARAITVTKDSVISKLHVRGTVLDREELVRVMTRLAPAERRLLLDLRIDPEGLVRALGAALKKHNITGATVHPFIIGPRYSIFVGIPAEAGKEKLQAAELITADFIAAPERATVEFLPAVDKPVN